MQRPFTSTSDPHTAHSEDTSGMAEGKGTRPPKASPPTHTLIRARPLTSCASDSGSSAATAPGPGVSESREGKKGTEVSSRHAFEMLGSANRYDHSTTGLCSLISTAAYRPAPTALSRPTDSGWTDYSHARTAERRSYLLGESSTLPLADIAFIQSQLHSITAASQNGWNAEINSLATGRISTYVAKCEEDIILGKGLKQGVAMNLARLAYAHHVDVRDGGAGYVEALRAGLGQVRGGTELGEELGLGGMQSSWYSRTVEKCTGIAERVVAELYQEKRGQSNEGGPCE